MGSDLYTQAGITPNFNIRGEEATRLIGLSGYARSGKDTVAGLVNVLYGHKQVAFADRLKKMAREINPYVAFPSGDRVRLDTLVSHIGWEDAKKTDEVRRFLQELGTRARNHFGVHIWVNSLMDNLNTEGHYVISDVRFPNEADRIIRDGGEVYRVVRPGVGPVVVPGQEIHKSETAMDGYPYFADMITNDGTIMDLQGEVMRVLGDFR